MDQRPRALKESLESTVELAIKLANEKGLDRSIPVEASVVHWLEPVDDNREEGKTELREEPSSNELVHVLGSELLQSNQFKQLEAAAIAIMKAEGHQHDLASSSPGIRLLTVYFSQVGVLELNAEAIKEVARKFETAWRSTSIEDVSQYLMKGFSAAAPVATGEGLILRPINKDDISRYGRIRPGSLLISTPPWISSKDWVCEITSTATWESPQATKTDIIDALCIALRLAKPGRVRMQLLGQYRLNPFLRQGVISGQPFVTSRLGGPMALTEAEVKTLGKYFVEVRQILQGGPLRPLSLPLRRLRLSANRTEPEDELVDYVIGLERILAPDTPALESTHRFRLRGAALLPASFGTVAEREKFMNSLYKLLSDIVHGGTTKSVPLEILPRAEEALIAIIRWCIDHEESGTSLVQSLDHQMIIGGSEWANNR